MAIFFSPGFFSLARPKRVQKRLAGGVASAWIFYDAQGSGGPAPVNRFCRPSAPAPRASVASRLSRAAY
jgi:hypothetical protein